VATRKNTRTGGPKPKKSDAVRRSAGRLGALQRNLQAHLGMDSVQFRAIDAFQRLKDSKRRRAARLIIQESVIDAHVQPDARCALAISESESLLKGYATLDETHRDEIAKLIAQITDYLHDASRKRPLNVLMLAAPGAGKSHFIRQLAGAMKADRVQAVTFDMATMQSPDDMAQPVDELRNLKVNDRFPLLFLDEFDSDPSRYAGLLPLLWEGALHVGHRDLRLGKAVIVLAGSNPGLPKAMDQSAQMRLSSDGSTEFVPEGKLVDLLSRINGGVINIPDFDLHTQNRDRRIDKVCVTIALLTARFGPSLAAVPRSLLRFIAHTTFRYGVRSLAHLIEIIDRESFHAGALYGATLGLPFRSEKALADSSLKLHLLDKERGFGIVNRWKEFAKDKTLVKVSVRALTRWEFPFFRYIER
jgi:hypothetical protein